MCLCSLPIIFSYYSSTTSMEIVRCQSQQNRKGLVTYILASVLRENPSFLPRMLLSLFTRQDILELYYPFSSHFIAVALLQVELKWENDQLFGKLYHPLFVVRWLSQTCYFCFVHKSLSIRDWKSLGLNEKHGTLLPIFSTLLCSSGAHALKLSSSQQ